MRLLTWVLRLSVFFTLFAFALNNEQPVTVHWFFGYQWRAPLVIVVLAAVALGALLGVMAMLPRWWRRLRRAPAATPAPPPAEAAVPGADAPPPATATPMDLEHPPRIGL